VGPPGESNKTGGSMDKFISTGHLRVGERSSPPETAKRALLQRMHAFVEQHLGDPQLSPRMIAAAHNISIRTLHRLFETHHMTPAAWIRTRRLERCRHELADPQIRNRPIHAIAARWGFADAAHFTRAFRAAYELTPQDYRKKTEAGYLTWRCATKHCNSGWR